MANHSSPPPASSVASPASITASLSFPAAPTGAPLPLPPLSAPAQRAVESAGISDLRQLDGVPEKQVLSLHGLGPAQLGVLRAALAEQGLAMSDAIPGPKATGRNENATAPNTAASPEQFLNSLPTERRRTEGAELLELFGEVTGETATMWGPSMIGYGHHHYVYDSGREGDTFRVGFSPRASALSLYGLLGAPGSEQLLDRLGPHRKGKGCLYVTSLARVDQTVLRELIAAGWGAASK